FADRLLRPLEIEAPPSGLAATYTALLEFLILCLIESANRDLAFPFRFELAALGTEPAVAPQARGVCVACSVGLLTATGALRVFLPYASVEEMRRASMRRPPEAVPPGLTWNFPVSVGSVVLSNGELAGLEVDDV